MAIILLAIGVALTIHYALTSSNRAAEFRSDAAAVQTVSSSGAQLIAGVDSGLADVSMRYSGNVDEPQADRMRFDAARAAFFRQTNTAHAFVIFRAVASPEEALSFSRGLAEDSAVIRQNGYFLTPFRMATRQEPRPGVFPLIGQGGVLPGAIFNGAQGALAQAMSSGTPVSSKIFHVDGGGIRGVDRVTIGTRGTVAFWRFTPIRTTDPVTGRDRLYGAVGALIDATQLMREIPGGALALSGPVSAAELKNATSASPTDRIQVGVPMGQQGLFVEVSRIQAETGLRSLLFTALAGLLTLLGAWFVLGGESLQRRQAEIELRMEQRKFKRRSVELKRSEDRFRRLAESTNVVPWAADLKEQRFTYIGPQIQKLTGYPVASWCANGFWVGHVHPEDRRRIFSDRFNNLESGQYLNMEYRIRSANGRTLNIRNMMTITKRKDGSKVAQGYMLDLTEIKSAQIKLDQARKQAEEANKTKSEFLANMSHELRTPLNAVIGFAEVMKDELFGPIGERYKEYAENVHSSGEHLLDLINDVLDLSKIEAGKIELIEEETDLGVLLSECRTVLHERASSAGLHIRLEIPMPLPNVYVDNRRLKQIILNLMSNAIKFTGPGGRITLRGELHVPQGVRLTVSDTGIGMTKEEQEIAIEQFGQIDSELARQNNGTGLGLPITKSLLELHGGTLELESRKGAGTHVHCWLPMTRIVKGAEEKGAA